MESLRRILELGKKKATTPAPKTEQPAPPKSDRPKPADNRDFLSLRGAMKEREKAAGLKSGGMVRGCGQTKKGARKARMY